MKEWSQRCLPGLTKQSQGRLWIALQRRLRMPREQRANFPVPARLARSWAGQGWWALLTEFQDRPLLTALGLLATATYPFLWLALHYWHGFLHHTVR